MNIDFYKDLENCISHKDVITLNIVFLIQQGDGNIPSLVDAWAFLAVQAKLDIQYKNTDLTRNLCGVSKNGKQINFLRNNGENGCLTQKTLGQRLLRLAKKVDAARLEAANESLGQKAGHAHDDVVENPFGQDGIKLAHAIVESLPFILLGMRGVYKCFAAMSVEKNGQSNRADI